MQNSRRVSFDVGDTVKFQMPVDAVDIGVVQGIDGFYIYINITALDGNSYVIERYDNEILECLTSH